MNRKRLSLEDLMRLAYEQHLTIEGMVSSAEYTFFYDWPLAHSGSPVHVDRFNQMLGRTVRPK